MAERDVITNEAFETLITARRGGALVPADEVTVATKQSMLTVRLAGACITSCIVDDAPLLVPLPLNDLTKPDVHASHTLSPIGKTSHPGGKDGFGRWVDYRLTRYTEGTTESVIGLTAITPPDQLGLEKAFVLTPSALLVLTSLCYPALPKLSQNKKPPPAFYSSLGEHFCLPYQVASPGYLRLNGQPLNSILGKHAQRDMQANGKYWSSFAGEEKIQFPKDQGEILLSAGARTTPLRQEEAEDPEAAGRETIDAHPMLYFSSATKRICVAPTVGYKPFLTHSPKGIYLPIAKGKSALLWSRLELNKSS